MKRPSIAMTLTERAAARICAMSDRSDMGAGDFRLGIRTGGCAGVKYSLDRIEVSSPLDALVESGGARLFVAADAVSFLHGTVIDFHEDAFSSGFVFDNPNARDSCGCGASVSFAPPDVDDSSLGCDR